jgi:hypothetical protein
MLATLPILAYRHVVDQAFSVSLLFQQYATTMPDIQRLTQNLTRIKDNDPTINLPNICKTGFPVDWTVIQYNRGPLIIEEQDEFRSLPVRDVDETLHTFDRKDLGFGSYTLQYHLIGSNGRAIEQAEMLYYLKLYKIREITYTYVDVVWVSRIIHQSLSEYGQIDLENMGTFFYISWETKIFVPVLYREVLEHQVTHVTVNIYAHDLGDPDFEVPQGGELFESIVYYP